MRHNLRRKHSRPLGRLRPLVVVVSRCEGAFGRWIGGSWPRCWPGACRVAARHAGAGECGW
jgi:hypothetical protein